MDSSLGNVEFSFRDRPASGPPLPVGLVTFLMTDIEGSTRLFRQLRDGYVGVLAAHHALLRAPFMDHGGVEVGTEGDALFFAFSDAAEAVAACLEGQRALASHPWPANGQIRVRIGVHTSEARPIGHDYVDLAVHQVARISAGAHGGQVVLSEATATAARDRLPPGASLLPLGSFQLRGFPEPQRLFQLDHPDLRRQFPPLRLVGVVGHNLPFLRSAFIGRAQDRAALASLLEMHGIVTVAGLGGVGKSRLAIQVAFDIMDRFPDGAWLVDLAALSDPASVPASIAKAARIAEQPGRTMEDALIEGLSGKVVLLLLDSCEHLLDAVAEIAERLSRQNPHLVILATSREPLDIEGEVVWRVSPLPVLDPNRVESADQVASDDAIDLFVQRARAVSPQFELRDDNAGTVARIVAQVNGIPLAIELAASALGDRPLAGVLDGLADRFSLLTHGRRTAPPRHQTLRAALEWSLHLLAADERLLFARLAAFAGGVTTQGVTEVCRGLPGAGDGVPAMLRHLARASLLVPHAELPERWSMLDSVRELAAAELAAAGEEAEMAERHRAWFAQRVETTEADIGRSGHREVMRDLAADQDNIRRAIETALAGGEGSIAVRICAAMAPFWTSHGDWTEGCERLRAALAAPGAEGPAARSRGLVALGSLLLLRGELEEAAARFAEARGLATEAGDDVVLARALAGTGYLAFRRSLLGEAEAAWERALDLAEGAGDERIAAGILRSLAIAAGTAGRQDNAGQLLERAISLARRTADDQQLRLLLGSSAELKLWLGDYAGAEGAYGDALALASDIGDLSARPLLLAELGWVALLRGDVVTAERLATEAAELAEDLGNRRVRAHALRLTGEALMRRGDPVGAAAALSDALLVAEKMGAPAEVAGVRCSQACLALEQEEVEQAKRLVGEAKSLSALSHSMRRVSLEWVLGVAALMEGDLNMGERLFGTEAEAEFARLGFPVRLRANNLWGLAQIRAARAEPGAAAALHHQALELRGRMGDGLGVVDSLLSLATVGGQIEPELAARVLGSAIALREQLGATPTRRESTELAAAEAAILSHADPDATDVAASVGEPIQENDAVALGLRLGALIRDAMPHMLTEVTPVTGQADRRNQRGMA